MSSIASAVGYNLNSMVNNAEEAAKSIYTSKRIDDLYQRNTQALLSMYQSIRASFRIHFLKTHLE